MLVDDRVIYAALSAAVAVLALAWFVVLLARVAARRRPDLTLARPLAAAAAMRLAVAGAVASVPALRPVRGPDETSFLRDAHALAGDPGALGELPRALVGNLHVAYMGLEERIWGAGADVPLRVGHIALAVAAIAIVSMAVADLADARAGRIAAWVLAFEPTNVFFSGVLHKEAPMLLGEAVVILGAVRMYQRRDPAAAALMVAGLAIAATTRPYAGAALGAACVVVCIHASLRRLGPRGRRAPAVGIAVALTAGAAAFASPAPASVLRTVQASQNANATDNSNLKLSPVDFSTVGSTARNIGPRVSAVLLRPLPWQVANMSQRLGAAGTIVAWALLLVTLALVLTRLPPAMARLAPLWWIVAALTLAYALSAGNAGTGFRYRTHLLLGLAAGAAALTSLPRTAPWARTKR